MNYINQQNAKPNVLRLPLIILAGAGVTFLLFAGMHAMIKQDIVMTKSIPEPVFIDSILDIEETITVEQNRPKPPPEILEQPKVVPLIEDEPAAKTVFTNYVSTPTINLSKGMDISLANIDTQPRPMVRTNPQYPSDAARNGIEGYVSLSFGVSPSGQVIDIEIIDAEPKRTFNNAAKRALSKWRYQPKKVDGRAVAMSGLQVRLDFSLEN